MSKDTAQTSNTTKSRINGDTKSIQQSNINVTNNNTHQTMYQNKWIHKSDSYSKFRCIYVQG